MKTNATLKTTGRSGWGAVSRGALFSLFACASLVMVPAQATIIVAPNSRAAVEGDSNNGFPFNLEIFSVPSMRYQQVFASSQFSALPGPALVNQIAFRPDDSDGDAFSSLLPNVQINLSTTSIAPDSLSSTFASNVGGDDMVVFSGPLSLSSADVAGAGNTRAFDILINLTTPFLYDFALGNLLLDVRNFGGGFSTAFDAEFTAGDSISRVYNASRDVNALTGSQDTLGLVAQFNFGPVGNNVPEPGTVTLLALGLCGLLGGRRRRC